MPRFVNAVPKYRKHRAGGQAVVTIHGQDRYLGAYGTKASRLDYDRPITEWLAAGRPVVTASDPATDGLAVTELLARFWGHAKTYYRRPDGSPPSDVHNLTLAFRPLKRLYGNTPAASFGPLGRQAVRKAVIDAGTVPQREPGRD